MRSSKGLDDFRLEKMLQADPNNDCLAQRKQRQDQFNPRNGTILQREERRLDREARRAQAEKTVSMMDCGAIANKVR
eukprot:CAMPEP_0206274076 /NCGR_PEP_ID=MMETSP0047_2-20121206/34952_1 /ASSEMBLY_ACC=CAM_ASM_000192 /TAXON_ID=195065 /ORGANISM="Chroomonas mesostigmatica_cf, Strain CCMP1168" /LENGTH=76 /DNA_ID=CAMNT_0053703247 /DNA_START=360 /DNA_END=587 /DNA_ORIENTATION=+